MIPVHQLSDRRIHTGHMRDLCICLWLAAGAKRRLTFQRSRKSTDQVSFQNKDAQSQSTIVTALGDYILLSCEET